MPKKPPATRGEHVTLNFGLVNVAVDVYGGTDAKHGVQRAMFTQVPKLDDDGKPVLRDGEPVYEDHPVGYGNLDKETGELVPPGQPVIKKIATEYGHVYVEDHEIEHLFDLTPKMLTVKSFQPQALFHQGHYVPKSLYYVEASKTAVGKRKVPNKAAEETLALVFKAMREEGAMAVVEYTTRGVPKPAVLLPDGTLWVVYHTDALREQRPLPELELASAVVDQGRMLIKALWSTEPLDLTDTRSALIQNFADEKAAAGDFGQSEAPAEVSAPAAPAMDLAAILAASIEAAKKQQEAV